MLSYDFVMLLLSQCIPQLCRYRQVRVLSIETCMFAHLSDVNLQNAQLLQHGLIVLQIHADRRPDRINTGSRPQLLHQIYSVTYISSLSLDIFVFYYIFTFFYIITVYNIQPQYSVVYETCAVNAESIQLKFDWIHECIAVGLSTNGYIYNDTCNTDINLFRSGNV